jgi:copper(I)-binding protein
VSKRWTGWLAAGLLSLPVAADDSEILRLEGAWVRALPPTQKVTAAYLTVTNTGSTPVIITGGEADLAAEVQIHTTREIDGYTRMEQLSQLELPAGGSARLEPGGTHLMLMQLQRMPQAGERVRLCLSLSSGQSACTEAEVKKSAAAGQHHHHHQHH